MSPGPLEDQGDLFPFRSPVTVALYLERARRRVEAASSWLSADACARILGEVALLELLLDRLEAHQVQLERFRTPSKGRWHSPPAPIAYQRLTSESSREADAAPVDSPAPNASVARGLLGMDRLRQP